MQPPPPLYQLWAKAGVDQHGVRSALLDCGYPNSSHVDGTTITNNDYARGEQCMLGKGFAYQERYSYCDTHPDLAACPKTDGAAAASRQRPPAYEQWTRPDADAQRVQQAMRACGYASVIEPGDDMLLNDIAAAQLCMLDGSFQFTLPASALLCRNPPPAGGLPQPRDRHRPLLRAAPGCRSALTPRPCVSRCPETHPPT
ncbi:hypothetical protein [Achromobacter xylosoxidans]|uniref:hypothetical protein n=1 Tax=Alcaligenes xylosoxydans xylosoxydans TaxID=85698 RepID=UPI001F141F71|nr:hypothetical protein [Achromobacter xylosoxidans]